MVPRTAAILPRVVVLTRCAVVCAADLHDAMGSAQFMQRKQRPAARNRPATRSSTDPLLATSGGPPPSGGPAVPGPPPWLSPAPSGDAYSTTAASSSVIVSSLWERLSRLPRSLSSTARRSVRPVPTLSTHQMSPLVLIRVTSSPGTGFARSHFPIAVCTWPATIGVRPRSSIRRMSVRPGRAAAPSFVPMRGEAGLSAAGSEPSTSRASKPTIVWGRPSSRMVKSSRVRPRTGAPDLSRTTTSTVMAETWAGNDGGSGVGSWPPGAPASGKPAASNTANAPVERIRGSVYCWLNPREHS